MKLARYEKSSIRPVKFIGWTRPLIAFLVFLILTVGSAKAEGPVQVDLLLSQDMVRPGDSLVMAVRFRIDPGFHIYSANSKEEDGATPTQIELPKLASVTFGAFEWPKAIVKTIPSMGTFEWFEKEVIVKVPIKISADAKVKSFPIQASVTYGACTETICQRFDQEPVNLMVKMAPPMASVKPQHSAIFAKTIQKPNAAVLDLPKGAEPVVEKPVDSSPASSDSNPFGSALSRGVFMALLISFGWGILASLSPCVYPMIPITIAIFASQASQSKKKTVGLALCYVAGIVVMYASLGIFAARAGQDIGVWLANPWVVGGLSAMFIAMALSMFGVFEMTLPSSWTTKLQQGPSQGPGGAFFMGVVLGFVAAPCVGPFAASILAVTATHASPYLGFFALSAFGLGMGMLFLFLAIFAGNIKRLPRSGAWMEKVKEISGFLLLFVTLYFLKIFISPAQISMIGGALLVWMGLHFGSWKSLGEEQSPLRRLWQVAMILCVATGAVGFVVGLGVLDGISATGSVNSHGAEEIAWIHDLESGVRKAQLEGKPVILDFYGDWCIPCAEMDRTTFRDPEVVKAMGRFVTIKADCTKSEMPGAMLKAKKWREMALPFYALYDVAEVQSLKQISDMPFPKNFVRGKSSPKEFLAALKKI